MQRPPTEIHCLARAEKNLVLEKLKGRPLFASHFRIRGDSRPTAEKKLITYAKLSQLAKLNTREHTVPKDQPPRFDTRDSISSIVREQEVLYWLAFLIIQSILL